MKTHLSWTEKLTLGLLLILLAALLNYTHLTERLDNSLFDFHLGLWSRTTAEEVVLVRIDDRSIEQLGRWPWPRRFHAKLLEILHDSKAVGLDILFPEPDASDPEGDEALATAIAKHGRVVLPVTPGEGTGTSSLREVSSIPLIKDAAAAAGHVDIELESDGISRSAYLKAGLGIPDKSVLPLAMLELHQQVNLRGERNQQRVAVKQVWVRDHRIMLPFSITADLIPGVSYVDVLEQQLDTSFFRDKWVLVGMDATGLGDRIPTPVSESGSVRHMAGVEYEAQLLDILLRNYAIQPIGDHVNLLITTPLIISLLLLFTLFRSEWTWLATLLSVVLTVLICLILSRLGYFGQHYWFRPGPALISLLAGYALLHRHQLADFLASLRKEQENAETTLNTVSDGIIITDKAGRVEFMNPNAEALTGHLLKNVRGQAFSEVMVIQDAKGLPYPIDLVAKSQASSTKLELPDQHFLLQRNGQLLALRATAKPFIDQSDEVTGVVIAFDEHKTQKPDVTRNVIDDLTKLPNLTLLTDRLSHAITNANRNKRLVAVLFIDLDDLNKINNAFGKDKGDQLLKETALRLTSRGRTGDTVARAGDDEFIVILENLENTDPIGSVTTSLLDVIRQPCNLKGEEISVDASIGISVYPKDGLDVETLKNNAYTAMKRAKKNKRQGNATGFFFYSQKMNQWALDRLLSEKDLRKALVSGDFELYYQPRVDFINGQIVAVEALIRWHRPGDGLILPSSFIPLAERSGLITEIGSWVLNTACQQARAWENANIMMPRMALNISPRQFMQHDLLDMITRVLDKSELDPRFLELEITENSLVRDTDRCMDLLKEFRSLGGTVSIDDFGTGYSSLSYLKNFPVDILKVDKVFTRDITTEPDHAAITLAVISMAHSLNLRVVAEGIENAAQVNFLRARGCDELQGYYFSEPVPAAAMTKLLEEKRRLKFDDITDDAAKTLLMVDDDNELLSYIGTILKNEGYRLLVADTAEAALDLLATNPVGVVISDEVMPGMQGSELLKKVHELYPETVRILLSANADRDAIIRAVNTGAIFKFLDKPLSENDLKHTLKEAFTSYMRKNVLA